MAQQVIDIGCGEYGRYLINAKDGLVYEDYFDPVNHVVKLTANNTPGEKWKKLSGALYSSVGISEAGNAAVFGQGSNTPTKVPTDSKGQPFTGNTDCAGLFGTYTTVRNGQLWYWGADDLNMNGKKAITQPIQLQQPAGVTFVQVKMANIILALTDTGDLWQYNPGNPTPVKVSLPGPVTAYAASWTGFYIAIVAGVAYGWGTEYRYMGASVAVNANSAVKLPWAVPPIVAITANHNVIHFIDNAGQLWGLGDNAMGEVGIGDELVNKGSYVGSPGNPGVPYRWSWSKYENMISTPVKVAVGIKFTRLWCGESYAFWHMAEDATGQLYFWGRRKSWVGGVDWSNSADYPNAYDVTSPAPIDPFNTANVNLSTFVPGSIVATDQAIKGSIGSFGVTVIPPTGRTIVKYLWEQLSGSPISLSPNNSQLNLSALTAGNYSVRLTTTDSQGGTMSKTINVGVSVPNQPPIAAIKASAGTLQLPANSVTLDGLPSSDPDGTVVGWSWSQISGPSAATLSVLSGQQTVASNLQAGTYVFGLKVIDNGGLTASAMYTVTVFAAATIIRVDITKSDGSIVTTK
jgi:hypothetical protein